MEMGDSMPQHNEGNCNSTSPMEQGDGPQQNMSVAVNSQAGCKVEVRKLVMVVEEDVVELWRTVAATLNLATDLDVCKFLLSLYFNNGQNGSGSSGQGAWCSRCHSLLALICARCQLPSQVLVKQDESCQTCAQLSLPSYSKQSLQDKSSQTCAKLSLLTLSQLPVHQSSSQLPPEVCHPSLSPQGQKTLQQSLLTGVSQGSNSSGAPSFTSQPLSAETSLLGSLSVRDEDSDECLDLQVFNGEDDWDGEVTFEQEKIVSKSDRKSMEKEIARIPTDTEVRSKALSEKNTLKTAVVVLHRCDSLSWESKSGRKEMHNSRAESKASSKTKEAKHSQESEGTDAGKVHHRSKHTCPACNEEFTSKRGLSMHVKTQSCRSAQQDFGGDNSVMKSRDMVIPKDLGQVDPSLKMTGGSTEGQDGENLSAEAMLVSEGTESSQPSSKRGRRAKHEKAFLEHMKPKRKCKIPKNTMERFMSGNFASYVQKVGFNYIYSHYVCHKCKTVFATQAEWNAHRYWNSKGEVCQPKDNFDAKSLEILERVKEQYLHCCPHCPQVFYKKRNFKLHIKTHEEQDQNPSDQVNNSSDNCSAEDDESEQQETGTSQTGKYPIYGKFSWQQGDRTYYTSYTCSQCKKVFTLKSAFMKHMETPTCDDDVSEQHFKRWKPDTADIEALQPRAKRKSALKAKFVHTDDDPASDSEGEEDAHSDDEKKDASFRIKREPQKRRIPNGQRKRTLEEFMAGKFMILLPEKGACLSHYTCFKCNTVLETQTEFYHHRIGKGDNPCPNPEGNKPPPRTELDSKSIELLLKIKKERLTCCPKCDEVFGRKEFYSRHAVTHACVVNDAHQHTCTLCQEVFSEYDQLYKHVAIKPGKETCPVCSMVFTSHCQIASHLSSHPDDERFTKCRCCGESVPHSEIRAHRKTHEKEKRTTSTPRRICPVCGKGFSGDSVLSKHMLKHSDERPFSCKVCDAKFKSTESLARHELRHGSKHHLCTICGARFVLKTYLRLHMQSRHQNLKFECSVCGHVFKTKLYHDRHKHQHFLTKSKECTHCGLMFKRQADLIVHMRIHTAEKPFQCPFCPAKFKRKDYLRSHKRRHTGEKPFVCEDCGKGFASMTSYKFHHRKCHSDRLLPCLQCGKFFVDQSRLNYHREREHPVDITELIEKKHPLDRTEREHPVDITEQIEEQPVDRTEESKSTPWTL